MKHIPTQIMSLALPCNQDQAKTFKGEQITDRPISLMSINIEIPHKILTNKVHEKVGYDQVRLLLGMQDWFSIQTSVKFIMIISIDAEK